MLEVLLDLFTDLFKIAGDVVSMDITAAINSLISSHPSFEKRGKTDEEIASGSYLQPILMGSKYIRIIIS